MKTMDATEVAKLVRKSLKEAFPATKFSVRVDRYSMGCSLRGSWEDGPRTSDVDKSLRVFEGKRFDGMDDSSRYVRHSIDGEEVHFGCDYVQGSRTLSQDFRDRALAKMTELRERDATAFLAFLNKIAFRGDPNRDTDHLVWSFAHQYSEVEPKGSVTATAIVMANPFLIEERA